MIKKITSMICLTLILASVNLISFAYSTDQYDIDIPDSLVLQDEGDTQDFISTFVSAENENCELDIVYRNNMLDFDLSEKNLNFFKESFYSQYESATITSEVTTFTKNNYRCFYYSIEIPVDDATGYMETYITKSGSDCYYITLFSDNKEFLESESIKNMIDSFTIKNYSSDYTDTPEVLQNSPLVSPNTYFPLLTNSNNSVSNIRNFSVATFGFIGIYLLFKVIAIIIAFIIIKKNNRRVTAYEEQNNSRQLENEQNPGGDENLN